MVVQIVGSRAVWMLCEIGGCRFGFCREGGGKGGGGSLDTRLRRCVIRPWIHGNRCCYWTSLGAYGLVKSYSAVLLHPPRPLSMIPLVKERLFSHVARYVVPSFNNYRSRSVFEKGGGLLLQPEYATYMEYISEQTLKPSTKPE